MARSTLPTGLTRSRRTGEPMPGTRLAALAVCGLLLVSAVGSVGAVHDTGRTFTVALDADGSATVTDERSYNLSVPAERDRYERLANDSAALEERRAAFGDRLRAAAANGSDRTARDMRIENVTVTTRETNGTGVIAYRARWVALAGVYGAQVVVNEPFSSGFDPNGTLVVRGPEGYVRDDTAPRPDRALRNSASWGDGTDLDGFSFRVVDPNATTSADDTDDGGPAPAPSEPTGVGRLVGAAGLALVPALLVFLGAKRRELRLEGTADADDGAPQEGGGDAGADGDGADVGPDTGPDGG